MTKILSTLFFLSTCLMIHAQTSYGTGAGTSGGNTNSFFGYYTGYGNTGFSNTAIGHYALNSNTTGNLNTAVGRDALKLNVGGHGNTAYGTSTLLNNLQGNYNTALGYNSGALNLGSGNVFIGYAAGYNEASSNKLYIANSSTASPLIWGDFSAGKLNFNANVGIGTKNPSNKLTVYNGEFTLQTDDNTEDQGILYQNKFGSYTWRIYRSNAGSNYADLRFASGLSSDFNSLTDKMIIDKDGNIGIGATTISHKLTVNGTIRAKEIIVNTGWSDFVFEDEYNLRSLEEVETFIEENGHLPDIPSAAEVEEKGVKVGEMESKLLQKIEELTLHLFDLNKRLKMLETENQELKSNK